MIVSRLTLVLGSTKYENDRFQSWLVLGSTWMKMIVTSWILVRQNGSDFCQSLTGETISTKCLHWGEVDHIQPLALEVDQKKVMILFSRLHWRSIHWEEKWSYSAAWTEGQSEKGDLIQPFALKVDPWGRRWSYSAAYIEGQSEKGDLIQPLALKVNPWRERWSYSAACTEGRSLRVKVILFSRLIWRLIRRRWRWSYSAACTEGRSLRKMMILFSRLHWRSIHWEKGCLTDYHW